MAADLDFRVLGPVEVQGGGRTISLGHGRQRLLLVLLLLSANETVGTDRLIEELWPDERPETALTALHGHVSSLRKLLGGDRLLTRRPGYILLVGDDEVDMKRFESLLEEARVALDAPTRDDTLSRALALWRGEPLADVPHDGVIANETLRLQELRLAALDDRVDARLAMGRHAELVPELERRVREQPLRERSHAQLMLALYRGGRQAEALQAYQVARRLLIEEIGVEPGHALRDLERQILAQDPDLELRLGPGERPSALALATGPSARPAGRRSVTILFTSASTESGGADPELLARLTEAYVAQAGPVLERHEASVQRVLDSVLGIFGIPRLHDDDALRAVRAAAELRPALRELGGRIGIATGDVFVEDPDAEVVRVTGDPVKLATRLEGLATRGQVLLDDASYVHVRDAVDVEPVELEIPGGAAVSAWRLRDVMSGAPGVARRLDAPLVGRERDLGQLERSLDRVLAEETCHLATVLGPAGIGKSRLAGEFIARATARAQTVVGRCQPYGEGITYLPLAEIVRQLAPDDPAAELMQLLADEPQADEIVSRVLGATGIAVASTPTNDEIFAATRELFECLARRRPLVVVLEDIHWAEPTLLDLIEHLAEWVRDAPLFLLCLSRLELLERRKTWAGGKLNTTSLLLEGVSAAEASILVANVDGRGEVDPAARGMIVAAAQGNPLFLEQMTAAAREAREGGTFQRPRTIDALLAARLDRLPPLERAAIECAAVQGTEFRGGAIADLLPDAARPDIASSLRSLVGKELIRPTRRPLPDHETHRFRHDLIRQAAYDGSSKATRAELHEQLSNWLRAAGETSDDLLGYHLERAFHLRVELGQPEDRTSRLGAAAGEYLAAAGLAASARGDIPATINLLDRATHLLPSDIDGRPSVEYALGAALWESGELARAEHVLASARDDAATAGDRLTEARAKLELAWVSLMLSGDLDALVEATEEILPLGEELEDDHVLAKALFRLGFIQFGQEQYARSTETLERALVHARAAGDRREEADIVYFVGAATFFGPTPVREAIGAWEERVEASRDKPALEAAATHALGPLYGLQERFEEGRAAIGRALEIYTQMGMSGHLAGTTFTLAELELHAGDWSAAEHAVRPGYESFVAMGENSFVGGAATYLARALYEQGRYDEAQELVDVVKGVGDAHAEVDWRAIQAKLLARHDGVDGAIVLAREAVERCGRGDSLLRQARMLEDLAEVLRLAGCFDESSTALEDALNRHERKENAAGAARVRTLLARSRETPGATRLA